MILREGTVPITVTGVAAALVSGLWGWLPALPLWLVCGWLCWLFWEHRPPRPADPRGVLAPVSGRVLAVGEDSDAWLERSVVRITIRVPFPGVVPLRSPTEGRVMDLYTRVGVFGEAQRACAPDESPDCYGQWLRTDEEEDVVYALSSRCPISRARFDHAPGERAGQGAPSGFMYFVTVADVLLPTGSAAAVTPGEPVHAGESVLARLPRA